MQEVFHYFSHLSQKQCNSMLTINTQKEVALASIIIFIIIISSGNF